jgi:hypothetical protein
MHFPLTFGQPCPGPSARSSSGRQPFCQFRSIHVVSTWPSINAEWLKISRCKGIVVLTPSTANSARARCAPLSHFRY